MTNTARNPDFIHRYSRTERKQTQMERRIRPYFETIIVGGDFSEDTIVPPFFVPFGGEIVAMKSRLIAGSATIFLEVNGDTIIERTLSIPMTVYSDELAVADSVSVQEGDLVGILIDAAEDASGLSVGVVLEL